MQLEVGNIVEGKITGIAKFGAFVDLGNGKTGLIHISEVSREYVTDIASYLHEGDIVKVKVLKSNEDGKISLSIKQVDSRPVKTEKNSIHQRQSSRPQVFTGHTKKSSEPVSFEDMLSKFKQVSEERMSDIKRNTDNKRGSYSRRGSR